MLTHQKTVAARTLEASHGSMVSADATKILIHQQEVQTARSKRSLPPENRSGSTGAPLHLSEGASPKHLY